ncbi:hypothetical protein MY3296_001063 [Beauveria thailandica]
MFTRHASGSLSSQVFVAVEVLGYYASLAHDLTRWLLGRVSHNPALGGSQAGLRWLKCNKSREMIKWVYIT